MRKLVQCLQNSNKGVTVYETAKAIKSAGFDGAFVQWYKAGEGGVTISGDKQVALCRDNGLFVPFAHLGYERINDLWLDSKSGDDMIDGYIRDAENVKKAGVNEVVIHLTSKINPPKPNEIGVNRLIRLFNAAKDIGIAVALENNKVKGYFEYVFDATDYPVICLDVGHCHAHFNDDFDWKRFGKKIVSVHLHDNFGKEDEHLLPFDGTVPWGDYAKKFSEYGYKGDVTLESRYAGEYCKLTVDSFYRAAYERAVKIAEMIDKT